jgi:hypothetical protein
MVQVLDFIFYYESDKIYHLQCLVELNPFLILNHFLKARIQ